MQTIVSKKEWSGSLRLNHWFVFISILILIITGFYIAVPFTILYGETSKKFFMGEIRFLHMLFGIVLNFLFIWRIYLAFFSSKPDWKFFFEFIHIKKFIQQIKFYLFLEKENPTYYGLYGPIQSLAYLIIILILFLMIFTGFSLLNAGYHQLGFISFIDFLLLPIEKFCGGLANIRFIHHLLTWFFILFIIIHIYMAFWYDFVLQEGTVSSMINGYVFKQKNK